jgi:2-dehydropantoate 2-reductase
MRILVVGAGAVGGLFGGRLAGAGRDVTFLVRPARAAKLRRDGLQIVSPLGDLALVPTLVETGAIERPFDVVLLSVKAYGLKSAMDDLAPAIGPDTTIIPLLNGMRHIDELSARFGAEKVIGGLCLLVSHLDDAGRIVQAAPVQSLRFGEFDGTLSKRINRIAPTLDGGGFKAEASTTIRQDMWNKWIMLATLGAINCLMRGTIGDVEAAPGGQALAHAMLDEVLSVAAAEGFRSSDAHVAQTRATIIAPGSAHTTSMYRDLVAGNSVEVDQIIGDLCTRAAKYDLRVPLLAATYTNLHVYANRLSH